MPLAIAKLLASYFNCMKVTEMRLTPWLQLVLRKQSQNFCPKFPFCTCFSFFFFFPPLDSCFRDKLQPSEYLKCVSTISCSWFKHSLTWQQKAISISRFLSTMVQSLKKKCWKYQWYRAAMNSWAGCALHYFKWAPFGQTINVNDLLWGLCSAQSL